MAGVARGPGCLSAWASLNEATLAARTAENEVALAREALNAAEAAPGGDPKVATDAVPSVRAALAQREAAVRNFAKAEVVAPVTGNLNQLESLYVGQYVTPVTMVANVVETDDTWVEANFKETQVPELEIGQAVEVEVEACPGFTLDSIGSTTGLQLSLIPAPPEPVRLSGDPDGAGDGAARRGHHGVDDPGRAPRGAVRFPGAGVLRVRGHGLGRGLIQLQATTAETRARLAR